MKKLTGAVEKRMDINELEMILEAVEKSR